VLESDGHAIVYRQPNGQSFLIVIGFMRVARVREKSIGLS
jgi:hypothetical protein